MKVYPSYKKYKPSNIDWLGEIPEHWEIKKLKYSFMLKTQKATGARIPVALENIESWTGKYLPSESEFEGNGIAFESHDILFGKLRPYLAKVWAAEFAGGAIGDFFVLHPLKHMNSRFAAYYMRTSDFINLIDGSTFGSKMPRASWDFFSSTPINLPPLSEQQMIADFLDRETAKIYSLIQKRNDLIKLLQEKRSAVISHAVTKGIDPTVRLKPSNIDWLGEIPEHWEVKPLKYEISINDNVFSESTNPLMEFDYIDIGGVSFDLGIVSKQHYVFEDAPSRARRKVKAGNVIVSTVRTYLRAIAFISPEDERCIVSTGFAVLCPKKIHSKYLSFFCLTAFWEPLSISF